MNFCKILGINFINGEYSKIIFNLNKGGLMVIPSGPGLATIPYDSRYKTSVQNSDFALPDSAYMVFIVRLFKGIKIKKYSGYKFLQKFLLTEKFNLNDIYLIDPNSKSSVENNKYLNKNGIPTELSQHYAAPVYDNGQITDEKLLASLESLEKKPKYIIINLGSGVQEPLGFYLKQNLSFSCSIICSGAAIAFYTGSQANISKRVDNLGLGWFWRCIKNPRIFIPRYLRAFSLIRLILKEEVEII